MMMPWLLQKTWWSHGNWKKNELKNRKALSDYCYHCIQVLIFGISHMCRFGLIIGSYLSSLDILSLVFVCVLKTQVWAGAEQLVKACRTSTPKGRAFALQLRRLVSCKSCGCRKGQGRRRHNGTSWCRVIILGIFFFSWPAAASAGWQRNACIARQVALAWPIYQSSYHSFWLAWTGPYVDCPGP